MRISDHDDAPGSERALCLYAHGFGIHDVRIGLLPDSPRPVLTTDAIMLPASMPMRDRRHLADAAVAHALGHLKYSVPGQPVGARAPMMVAMQSLIEDARVERLMARDHPGLRALWGHFHRLEGEPCEKGLTFAALAERLTLALHDPAYRDPHHWVEKGRALIDGIGADLTDVTPFQEAASILASDLGQMRVRFDPRSYVVEAPYRDDNTFLWRFEGDEPVEAIMQAKGGPAQGIVERSGQHAADESGGECRPQPQPVKLLYPEWNYKTQVLREDWVGIVEGESVTAVEVSKQEMAVLKKHDVAPVRYRQACSAHRLKRQAEGDDLDLDALVAHVAAARGGGTPDGKVFSRPDRRPRPASVLILLDLSASTARVVDETRLSLLDCERAAVEQAMSAYGTQQSRVAVHGFASNGRDEVRYLRLKDFDTPYSDEHRRRMLALVPAWSTRLGAALRHAGECLGREKNSSKTIILVTDGEPSDIDVFDPRYLLEDARHAVDMLASRGIRTQCVSVDPRAHAEMCSVFGRRHCTSIERSTRLANVLPNFLTRAIA